MEIKVQTGKLPTAEVEEFNDFQGELKELDKVNYEKLKKQIVELGFSAPIFIWENKGIKYILDGHQRKRVLMELKQEGYKVPKIPYVEILAKNKTEAKKKLLSFVSQYGKVTKQGLYEFISTNDIDVDFLRDNFQIPEINLDLFKLEFFSNGEIVDNPLEEWAGMPEFKNTEDCYRTVVVSFNDQASVETFFKIIGQDFTDKTKSIWFPAKERRELKDLAYDDEE